MGVLACNALDVICSITFGALHIHTTLRNREYTARETFISIYTSQEFIYKGFESQITRSLSSSSSLLLGAVIGVSKRTLEFNEYNASVDII